MNQKAEKNYLKIISLGGFGQVTNNMFVYETEKDILIVDCGIGFPTEEMRGVDLLIPDVSYLLPKKQKIKGLIISHGHDDHIGALPYILPKLGKIPVFGSKWALALAREKLSEFGFGANFQEISEGKKLFLGNFQIEFIEVTHSIPETMHLVISTPIGIFYHAADFKLDLTPVMGKPTDQNLIVQVGKRGVFCLLSDCLRAEREGFTPSEAKLQEMFEREIEKTLGKFFVTTMSSNISRLKQAIEVSQRHKRKVVLVGRSVEENVAQALKLSYLKFPPNLFLSVKEARRFPALGLTFLVAGSQGQPGSALEKIVAGEHEVKIERGDKVVFSTDYIPGNEAAIYALIDEIMRQGGEVSYADVTSDVHVSGHGSSSDLKKLIEMVKPKFVLPIGGNFRHMIAYQKLAQGLGFQKDRIILPDNGQIVKLFSEGRVDLSQAIEVRTVMVDALGVGDVGNVVLRDRKILSQEGIVVAIILIDQLTFKLLSEPEIVTRGFVYVKESEKLIRETKTEIKKILAKWTGKKTEFRFVQRDLQDALEKFFFQKTGRRPIILTQVIKV
ncbi:MAG: ribonuclease J [Patescibacteria group bacterium]